LQLNFNGATLSGGGSFTMSDSTGNVIQGINDHGGGAGTDVLTNDSTIEGAGTIGGNGLGLVNNGLIDAEGTNPLILNTGTSIANSGTLEATSGSTLQIHDNLTGAGSIEVGDGSTVELEGTSTNAVTFGGATGTLQIDSSGTASAFSIIGNGTMIPQGDHIFLPNISFDAAADGYNASTDVITVGNGSGGTVTIDVVGGIGSADTFVFSSQGNGTLITDPVIPSSNTQGNVPMPAALGGQNFAFHPWMSAQTIGNRYPQQDTVEFNHFNKAQSVQQLAALSSPDVGDHSVIDLGSHDSIPIAGLAPIHFQQAMASAVHLH